MSNGINPTYRLRWRFDYVNRPSKVGMWLFASNKPEEMACFQNTEGLLRAAVECESLLTWKTEIVVECDGHDFVEFRWVNAVSVNPLALQGSVTSPGTLVGLELITKSKRATCLVNGKFSVRDLTPAEMLNKLEQYSK
jgi:hypothetical protein